MNTEVNIKLKEIRTSKGLSIRELSKLSSVSRSEISGIENGEIMPTIHVVCCLVKALKVNLESFIDYF